MLMMANSSHRINLSQLQLIQALNILCEQQIVTSTFTGVRDDDHIIPREDENGGEEDDAQIQKLAETAFQTNKNWQKRCINLDEKC